MSQYSGHITAGAATVCNLKQNFTLTRDQYPEILECLLFGQQLKSQSPIFCQRAMACGLEVPILIPHASYLVENQLVSCRRSRSDGTKRTGSSAKNREAVPWTRHSQYLCWEYGWGFSQVFNLVHRLPVAWVQEFIQMHFPPFDQIPQSGLRVLFSCWT